MAEAILVPQVGQDLTEAKIIELHVKLGDQVKKGDLVAVVESEKASFDVEAFSEGVVINLPYDQGDIATVLEPLMFVGEPDETVSDKADTPTPGVVEDSADAMPVSGTSEPQTPRNDAVSRSSPIARRTAKEKGLDIALVSGTGPGGAVVLRDVETLEQTTKVSTSGPNTAGQGIELRTLQAGQGSPIVFLHGFGADLSSWRPMVGQLSVGSPIMALDLPGHGSSTSFEADSFASIAALVGESLRGLSGGVHLVGHSLGAAIATALTERGDLDIRSLTLLSPAGLGPSINGSFIDGFLAARTEAALNAWMRSLVHDPAALAPVLVRATLAARDDPALAGSLTRIAGSLFEGSTQLFSVAAALGRFDGPCSIIVGRQDAIIPFVETESEVPANAGFHRLPGVGHLPQVEAAGLVRNLIARTVRAAG